MPENGDDGAWIWDITHSTPGASSAGLDRGLLLGVSKRRVVPILYPCRGILDDQVNEQSASWGEIELKHVQPEKVDSEGKANPSSKDAKDEKMVLSGRQDTNSMYNACQRKVYLLVSLPAVPVGPDFSSNLFRHAVERCE